MKHPAGAGEVAASLRGPKKSLRGRKLCAMDMGIFMEFDHQKNGILVTFSHQNIIPLVSGDIIVYIYMYNYVCIYI